MNHDAIERIVEDCDGLIEEIVRLNYPEIAIWPHTRVRSAIRTTVNVASHLKIADATTVDPKT